MGREVVPGATPTRDVPLHYSYSSCIVRSCMHVQLLSLYI